MFPRFSEALRVSGRAATRRIPTTFPPILFFSAQSGPLRSSPVNPIQHGCLHKKVQEQSEVSGTDDHDLSKLAYCLEFFSPVKIISMQH